MNPCCLGRAALWALSCQVLLTGGAGFGAQRDERDGPDEIRSVRQLSECASAETPKAYSISIEGEVWWAAAERGRLVLADRAGAAEIEMEWEGPRVRVGDRVRLEGCGTVLRRGAAFQLGARGPVVDNDGLHGMDEKSGAVYLDAGRQPLRLDWFNGVEKYGLEVEYQGPGLERQRVPDSVLFCAGNDSAGKETNVVSGLNYRCYEGAWESLPDFGPLAPVKTGRVSGFDLAPISRPEHVAMEFSGSLEIRRAGLYTFYLKSDDGSALFAGKPSLRMTIVGKGQPPPPRRLAILQTLGPDEDGAWGGLEDGTKLRRRTGSGGGAGGFRPAGHAQSQQPDSRHGVLPGRVDAGRPENARGPAGARI